MSKMSRRWLSKLLLLQLELQQQLHCQQQLEEHEVRVILDILVLVISDGVQGERHQHQGDGGEAPERGQDC